MEINLAKVTEIDTAGFANSDFAQTRGQPRPAKRLTFVIHSKAVLDILELSDLTTAFGDQVVLSHS